MVFVEIQEPVNACYAAKCEICGKTTWKGCGKHIDSVMAGVKEEDRLCLGSLMYPDLEFFAPHDLLEKTSSAQPTVSPSQSNAAQALYFSATIGLAIMSLIRENPPFDPSEVKTTEHLNAHNDLGRPMMNNYIRYARVGGGQHGKVYLCYKLDTTVPSDNPEHRLPVAMKSVRRDNPRAEQLKKLRQRRLPTGGPRTPLVDRLNTTEAKIRKEIAIMKKCRHPHVVRLYEVIDDRMRDKIYMVMEYLGGGEVKWRNDKCEPILTIEQTRRIMRDAVLGLEYLHYQGIIHRDIKPANLLWTEDRRQVKIGDFGVSHFSYAQRLAAAGKEGEEDPILLDDSDLTRRAGTPSFLAPEVVYEHTCDAASPPSGASASSIHAIGSSSTVASASAKPRPPITKAIDVWALGVTLYCLLFGRTPFFADPNLPSSEWSLYNSICNNDWEPLETMGLDCVPTGGRRPPDDGSEGSMVMHLLDHFLEKDVTQRITLDEVKRSPWILHGLLEPEKWLEVTSPTYKINVSKAETSKAMSNVRFSWNWSAMRRIFSNLRSPTRQRQTATKRRRRDQGDDGRGPVKSDPHLEHRIRKPHGQKHKHAGAKKREIDSRTPLVHSCDHLSEMNGCTPTQTKAAVRSKSIDRWYSKPAAASAIPLQGPSAPARRDSDSQSTTPHSPTGSDRPRAKFAQILASLTNWRSGGSSRGSPQAASAVASPGPASRSISGTASSGGATPLNAQRPRSMMGFRKGKGKVMRRSEEALRHHHSKSQAPTPPSSAPQSRYGYSQGLNQNRNHQQYGGGSGPSNASGPLTAARRASSWGYEGLDTEYIDVVSLRSDGVELNDHDMIVGAGGVANTLQGLLPRDPSARMLTATATIVGGQGPSLYSTSRTVVYGPPNRENGRVSFYDEADRARYGPPALDDTSTIASGSFSPMGSESGEWQGGSDPGESPNVERDDHGFGSPGGAGEDGTRSEGGGRSGDEDENDSDDEDDNRVTFSPRRHASPR